MGGKHTIVPQISLFPGNSSLNSFILNLPLLSMQNPCDILVSMGHLDLSVKECEVPSRDWFYPEKFLEEKSKTLVTEGVCH